MNNFIKTINLLQEKVLKDGSETFNIGKDLSDKEVKEKVKKLKLRKDHRGMHYNPKTGIVKFI
jgi:hypothetical protein